MRVLFVLIAATTFSAALSVSLTSCAAMHESKDFVRHTNSTLVQARDGSNALYFQAKAGADYPEDDPESEALRISWLEGWLEQRKLCRSGYEIVERREFGFTEHNPQQMDLVYEIKCTSAASAGSD